MWATTKWVSWTCQLNGTSASITPVRPPSTKITRKPTIHSIGSVIFGRPSHRVESQTKIWMPVGMATSMLAAEKKASASCRMPRVNMWWTHRPKLTKPMMTIAATTQA